MIKNSGISSNAGVMRLLRHLKKARLEELQQRHHEGPDTEATGIEQKGGKASKRQKASE